MAKFGIRTAFELEDFNSVNTRAQELLKKVSENSKIKLDFSDGMSLDKMKQQLDKLQQEIMKSSKQSSQVVTSSFSKVNTQFEQQIKNIEKYLKTLGSNVNVKPILDEYGKITGAVAKYKDEAGKVIERNYEVGNSFKKINGVTQSFKKLKLVDDNDLRNQSKALSLLEEEKRKIEQLAKTKAQTKIYTDKDNNITKATITYTDNVGRAVTETYKLQESVKQLQNTIKKTTSFEKVNTTYTDNIAKSIRTIEQYEKTIDRMKTKNLDLGNGQQSPQFVSYLKEVQSLLNNVKSSSQSMTQSTKKNIDTLINAMNLENKEIKKNNDEMKKKQKIMKDAPIAIQGYENKIVSLKNKYKELVKEADLSKLRSEMSKLANSKNPEEYARQLQVIRNEYSKLENTVKGRGVSVGQNDKMGIFSAISQAMTKFPIWIGATTAWMEAIRKVKDGIGFIADLDKAQTNIAMITGKSREQVAGLTKEYSKLAGEIQSTTKEMMGGAETYLRAGVAQDDIKSMLRASTIGSHISGQSNEDVSQQLITISNGFRMAEKAKEAGEDYDKVMMHVVDTLSTLDDSSASSFADIATALTRTSSSAQNVGVSFEEVSEYITIISHVTNKSAESIGESFKSIFARYRDIKLGKTVDELGEEISNVETVFKRVGINIRKDKTHFKDFGKVLEELKGKWKDLNDLDKSAVNKAIAGTHHAENFAVLMDNMDKLQGLDNDVKKGDGSAKRKNDTQYADSIQAKIDSFKYTWEQLYQTLLSSDALKKVINDVTYLVKWLDDLTKSSWGVKGSFVVLLPLTIRLAKGFKLVATAIAGGQEMKLGQMMMTTLFGTMTDGTVKVISLSGALSKLNLVMKSLFVTSPYGWIILGIATALGVGVHAFNKYQEKAKKVKEENEKLTESQKKLNESMSKGNVKGMKESSKALEEQQKKLNELFKKKKELEDDHNKGRGITTEIDLHSTKKEIKETIEQLKGLGYTVDETNGKIFQLESSKNVSKAFEAVEKIKKERQERVKNIDTIVSETDEYNKLSSAENLNSQEKERLKQLTQNLKGKVKDLKVGVDEHGNAVILNTDLLGKNKEMLIKERLAILNNKDASYANAKTVINNELTKTRTVIAETTKRMVALQREEDALKGKAAVIDSMRAPGVVGGEILPNIFGFFNNRKLKKVNEEYNNSKKQLEQLQKDLKSLESLENDSDKLINAKPEKSSNDDGDYRATDPEKTKKSTEATKENTGETDKNREAVNKAKEAVKQFELALKSLEIQMTKNNIALGRLYEHSDKYISKLKERQNLIKQEIALNKKQIATNGQLANSLGAVGGSYVNGMGNSIGEQVVRNAQQYLGRPYKWGGSNPSENFDCSGLVQYVYKQVGIGLNRTTYDQIKQGTPVSKNQLQVGDAIFFGSPSDPHHVGLYMGNGQYIHAPKTGDVIKVSSLNSRSDFLTARRYASGGGSVSRTTSSNYSGQYASYINEAASKYGVSASLIAAIIKAESNFNPNARSNKGAMGLMQLMPANAREFGISNPYDPRQSIMGGTQEIAKYLKKYNGNLDLALAAYNAGMGAVQKYGGIPPYKETKDYIPKVKKYMKEYGGSESSIHSTIDEQMDLIGKSMDLEKKNLELQEELNKINIQILEAKLGQYDDRVKSIDRTLTQLRTDVDLAGKNDTTYINYLLRIDEYSNKKLNTLKEKRAFLEKEMKSNIYDEKTIQMMREKNSELGTEMLNMLKSIKDLGYEIATARYEAIEQIYKDNIEMLNNEIERLSTEENKNLKSIIGLRQQMISQDEENIKRLTNLIKELNAESYKENKPFLLDKIEEYNKELDKANSELIKHKKELDNVKDTFNSVIDSIEDKVKQAIQKTNEEYKKGAEKRRKLFEESIDKQVEKIEEAKRKLDKNETAQNDYEKIMEIQEKINRLDLNDSIEAKKQRAELEKELRDAQRDQRSHEMNYEIEDRKKQLTNAKDQYGKLISGYDDKLGETLEDDKLTLEAKQAMLNGYIVDLNGNMIDLEKAIISMEDKFGKGLSSTGNKIKKDLIDNLRTVQDILKEFGTLDTTKIDFKDKAVVNVYGAGADLENARKILGIDGYNFVDTKMIDHNKIKLNPNDLVLGAKGTHNGLNRDDLGGATRLGGSNRYETAAIIQLYKDIQDGKVTPFNGVVYGSGQDLENAMKWLAPLGYKFVDTSKINPRTIRFTQSDLIVGGTGAKNGVPFDVSGVKRLGGSNRFDTDKQIEKYAKSQLETKINQAYRETNKKIGTVYATGIDLINAKKYLSKQGYTFVDTDSVVDKVLSPNDIVVGGTMKGRENIYNSGSKWLYGKDRHETANLINEFARYNNIRGFSTGGVVDYTGLAMVHGENNPELVLNNDQVVKLHNFIKGLPNSGMSTNALKFARPNISTTNNSKESSIINKYDINLIVQGDLKGTENDANRFTNMMASKLVDVMKKK